MFEYFFDSSKLNFMRKFGYLESRPSTSSALYREDAVIAAIKNVQKFGAINETGVLDNATLKVGWIMLIDGFQNCAF